MSTSLKDQVAQTSAWIAKLREEIARVIVGQEQLVDRLLVGLLAKRPRPARRRARLAKTLSVRTLAAAVQAKFHRIQFTPDLLPADIVGTLIYNPQDQNITPRAGRFSPTSFSPTKSTARRQKCNPLCWKRCRNGRSRSAAKR